MKKTRKTAKAGSKTAKKQNQQPKSVARTAPQPFSPGRLSSAPVAQGRTRRMQKPKLVSSANGNMFVVHREYIADVVAGTGAPSAFSSATFPINPGSTTTFPWLSGIAPRFEKYHFKKLKFCFETEAATALGGSVILTVDYDATDNAPTSKVQAMAYKNAVRSPPWQECCHDSAAEDLSQQRQYFVRTGALPANADPKLYDTGNLFFCSQNVATSGATLGELYVEYEIQLMTPQIPDTGASLAGGSVGSGGTLSAANPLGTAPVLDAQSSGISVDNASNVTFANVGTYLVAFQVVGTVVTSVSTTAVSGVVVTPGPLVVNSAGTSGLTTDIVVVTVGGGVLKASSAATTVTGTVLYVASAPSGSLS